MTTRAGKGSRRAVLYAGFSLTGVVTVLAGPLIPELSDAWAVSEERLAALFVAQFVSSSIGSLLSTRFGVGAISVGYVLIAAGLAAVMSAGWPLGLVAISSVGLGLGLVLPATNLLVAFGAGEGRGAALSTLNLFWGIGAVASPALFLFVTGTAAPALGILLTLSALSSFFAAATWLTAPKSVDRTASVPSTGSTRSAVVALLPFALMLFLYVGVESSIGGWIVTLSDRLRGERGAISLFLGSGFWLALLLGRALAPPLLRVLSESLLYKVSLAIAVLGASLLALADDQAPLAAAVALCGLGLASLFPLTVSLLSLQAERTGSAQTGLAFAFGGLGGAVLPWLSRHGVGTAPFLVPAIGLVLLGGLFVVVQGRGPTGAATPSAS